MKDKTSQERELFLYYAVFGTPEAQELLALWIDDILNTAHFQPQYDPNNTKTIRDMAVLEFIQGIKNRVADYLTKGVKNGPANTNTDESASAADNRTGIDTGSPGL